MRTGPKQRANDRSRYAAPSNPAPSRLGAARAVFVKNCQRCCDKREKNGPSADFNYQSGHSGKWNIRQSNRNCDNCCKRKQDKDNYTKGDRQSDGIEFKKTALLVFSVNDVERIEDSFDP